MGNGELEVDGKHLLTISHISLSALLVEVANKFHTETKRLSRKELFLPFSCCYIWC